MLCPLESVLQNICAYPTLPYKPVQENYTCLGLFTIRLENFKKKNSDQPKTLAFSCLQCFRDPKIGRSSSGRKKKKKKLPDEVRPDEVHPRGVGKMGGERARGTL